jgi:hypothetical protein
MPSRAASPGPGARLTSGPSSEIGCPPKWALSTNTPTCEEGGQGWPSGIEQRGTAWGFAISPGGRSITTSLASAVGTGPCTPGSVCVVNSTLLVSANGWPPA